MYRFGFVIEQALGHITHGQNLRHFVAEDANVEAAWCLPAWQRTGLPARMPLYRSNWTLQAGWQTRQLLAPLRREFRPQALFFHTQVTATLAQDWLGRLPSIVSLDATPRQIDQLGGAYQHAAGPEWLEQAKWKLNRRTFQLACRLVTWSAWAQQGLIDEYDCPPDKITVIPPGVDTTLWAADSQRRIKDGPIRILFVGADFQRKGGQVLLEAFRRLRQAVGSTDSVSDPALAVELHVVTRDSLPSEPGLVVHNGLQPNSAPLRQLYGECDLFCLPTQADCLPMALMEAGAAGLPLVSTRVAAIPEIVVADRTGLLVPPGDPVALAGALGRLAADRPLRQALGAGAAQLVQRTFSAQTNTQRLLELLKSVADERSGG